MVSILALLPFSIFSSAPLSLPGGPAQQMENTLQQLVLMPAAQSAPSEFEAGFLVYASKDVEDLYREHKTSSGFGPILKKIEAAFGLQNVEKEADFFECYAKGLLKIEFFKILTLRDSDSKKLVAFLVYVEGQKDSEKHPVVTECIFDPSLSPEQTKNVFERLIKELQNKSLETYGTTQVRIHPIKYDTYTCRLLIERGFNFKGPLKKEEILPIDHFYWKYYRPGLREELLEVVEKKEISVWVLDK